MVYVYMCSLLNIHICAIYALCKCVCHFKHICGIHMWEFIHVCTIYEYVFVVQVPMDECPIFTHMILYVWLCALLTYVSTLVDLYYMLLCLHHVRYVFVFLYSICTPMSAHMYVHEDMYDMWLGHEFCPSHHILRPLGPGPVHICVCHLIMCGLSPTIAGCMLYPSSHFLPEWYEVEEPQEPHVCCREDGLDTR